MQRLAAVAMFFASFALICKMGQAFRVNRMINNLRRVFVTIPVQIWIITNRVCWFTGHVIMWDPASITCHISVSFCCKLFKILIKIFTTKTYETVSEYFCQENDEIQTPCTKVLYFLFQGIFHGGIWNHFHMIMVNKYHFIRFLVHYTFYRVYFIP